MIPLTEQGLGEPGYPPAHLRSQAQLRSDLLALVILRAVEDDPAASTPAFAPSRSRYPAISLQSAEVGVTKKRFKISCLREPH